MQRKTREEFDLLIKESLSWCMKCGACLAFCPLYRQSADEGASMRGKLAILQARQAGRKLDPERVLEVLNRCVGCQNCKATCPNGIDTTWLTILVRMLMTEEGHPDWTSSTGSALRRFRLTSRLALAVMPLLIHGSDSLHSGRIWKTLPRRIYKALEARPDFSCVPANSLVIFPGCALSQDQARLGHLQTIFASIGIPAHVIADAGCCGMPELGLADFAGHEQRVKALLSTLVTLQPAQILLACPRCFTGFRYLQKLYSFTPEEEAVFPRISGLFDFLDLQVWEPRRRISQRFTVHDSCHQLRQASGKAPLRSLLKRILEHPISESGHEASCCGFGGSFVFRHPQQAAQLRRQRVEQLAAAKAEAVVTDCPYCVESLQLPLRRKELSASLLLDLLAESLHP